MVERSKLSQGANCAALNKGCIEDNREPRSVDQSMENRRVESPKCVEAMVHEAKPGKALLGNRKDMPPPNELGVNLI